MTASLSAARQPVTVEDIRTSTENVLQAFRHVPGELWRQDSEGLEWSRHYTLHHCVQVYSYLSCLLANGASITSSPPRFQITDQRLETEDLFRLLPMMGEVLIRVAEASPSTTRGWHGWGSPDPEGYLAQACNEILLHGSDITRGLDIPVLPSEELCERVLNRLYPWAPLGTPRWATMLWVSGRGELDGHPPITSWKAHVAPLSEWDGTSWAIS